MDNFFAGYNLNLTIPSKPDFVQIRPKLQTVAAMPKVQAGLTNYHLSHDGNKWSPTLVTLNIDGNKTIVSWGASDSTHLIPDISNQATIENSSNVQCFDAVWIRS